jgi:sugar-specific transcriptional regulator TrmB
LVVLEETDIDFLVQLGLTRTQAKVYSALLNLEVAGARAIYQRTDVPRAEVYRSLDELQKIGLIEKEIDTPYRFRAPPLELCVQILIAKKNQQHREFQKTAEGFLRKMRQQDQTKSQRIDYSIRMVQGKRRIEQLLRSQHQAARKRVDVLSTAGRWLQILEFCFDDYVDALEHDVEYRVFVEDSSGQLKNNERVRKLMAYPNFKLKVGGSPLKTNLAVFDAAEATINFFPSRPLKDSPLIVTNHPSFIQMCKDHFKIIWSESEIP